MPDPNRPERRKGTLPPSADFPLAFAKGNLMRAFEIIAALVVAAILFVALKLIGLLVIAGLMTATSLGNGSQRRTTDNASLLSETGLQAK